MVLNDYLISNIYNNIEKLKFLSIMDKLLSVFFNTVLVIAFILFLTENTVYKLL